MECSYHGKIHSNELTFDHTFCIQHGYCSNPSRCPLVKYCPTQRNYKQLIKEKPGYIIQTEYETCLEAIQQIETNIVVDKDGDTTSYYKLLLNELKNLKSIYKIN